MINPVFHIVYYVCAAHIIYCTAQRCVLPVFFRWIYYYGSNESTGKETGKMQLCVVYCKLTASMMNRAEYTNTPVCTYNIE